MTTRQCDPSCLTPNQRWVYEALQQAAKPLTAYELLDGLRDKGFRAPPQIYRALSTLLKYGLIHRLECLHAYIACRHDGPEAHDFSAFTICRRCGDVGEVQDHDLGLHIQHMARANGFDLDHSIVEFQGFCTSCAAE